MNYRLRTRAFLIAVLSCFTVGCGHSFDPEAMQMGAEAAPIHLDSEQVLVTQEQLNCGVRSELWEDVVAEEGQQVSYRLTQKGRDLHFNDDIYPATPGNPSPYAQLRGKFNLQLGQVIAITDGGDGTKLVQAKLGVRIPHPCFGAPLRMMGVHRGKFSSEVAPALRYEDQEKGWAAIEVVH